MTSGAALRQGLRSLARARRLLADQPSAPSVLAPLRDARLHTIGAEEAFRALKEGNNRDASWGFLRSMRDLGRGAAERWLAADLPWLGVRSTADLSGFAGPALKPTDDARRVGAA